MTSHTIKPAENDTARTLSPQPSAFMPIMNMTKAATAPKTTPRRFIPLSTRDRRRGVDSSMRLLFSAHAPAVKLSHYPACSARGQEGPPGARSRANAVCRSNACNAGSTSTKTSAAVSSAKALLDELVERHVGDGIFPSRPRNPVSGDASRCSFAAGQQSLAARTRTTPFWHRHGDGSLYRRVRDPVLWTRDALRGILVDRAIRGQ